MLHTVSSHSSLVVALKQRWELSASDVAPAALLSLFPASPLPLGAPQPLGEGAVALTSCMHRST
eukprot:993560-Rhodomonas_salina.1